MITTMGESGSSYEQIEFFIVNSQKVPKQPVEDPVWCLSFSSELEAEPQQPAVASSTNIEQNTATSQKRPGVSSNWPPTDWKSAPDRKYAQANYHLTRPGDAPYTCLSKEASKSSDNTIASIDQPVLINVDEAWIIEEASSATAAVALQDSAKKGKLTFFAADGQITSGAEPEKQLDDYMAVSSERDTPCWQTVDAIRHCTGRIGESIAYRYFLEKLGSGTVRWVNEETETGLPYDLIIGEDEDSREYIEVKATTVAKKKWFTITSREWQFAAEKGDTYSIAFVVMLEPNKAGVTVLKNPFRLCQQKSLKLALLMSDEQTRRV
ncbi:uncharacterized protein M6B38_336795 [Iris pallida]|uniref:Protein NO VEIN C-terminal domain-containing protein n=1 Tax=Iris pallida TaxID=29817 RepID=A0AAX6H036_IRIPA|nr:uncharacterized protein M6B38_336795 [Iris pallida]